MQNQMLPPRYSLGRLFLSFCLQTLGELDPGGGHLQQHCFALRIYDYA